VSGKTVLYRHFDANGTLLYVGISNSALKRLDKHKVNSHWAMDIARIELMWLDSKEEALSAERKAIQNESPLYNIDGRVHACKCCGALFLGRADAMFCGNACRVQFSRVGPKRSGSASD